MLSWTRVWTPTIISETRAGFTRLVTSRVQNNSNTDEFKALGIGGYDPTDRSTAAYRRSSSAPPGQRYSGTYSQIGANYWLPSKEYSNVWDFIENLSVTKGSHAMKFGAEVRTDPLPLLPGALPARRDVLQQPGRNGQSDPLERRFRQPATPMASFLLGNVNWGQISTTNFISSENGLTHSMARMTGRLPPNSP